MQRINTSYFYKLAQKLIPLRNLAAKTKLYFDNFFVLHNAQEELRFFLQNPLMPPLTSFQTGNDLLNVLEKITTEAYDENRLLVWGEPEGIAEALNHFEISLQSDFNTRDTFILSPKSTHSTTLLSERGETMISKVALDLVPSMRPDLHDAGRCITFELPTAGAFHLFRAVEAMTKAYGEFLLKRGFTDREKKNGLGGYAQSIKQTDLKVDKRIITAIEQVCALHRNPTMHPTWHITNAEILSTLGIVVSVVETIALDWNRRVSNPETTLLDLLPDDSYKASAEDDPTKALPDPSKSTGRRKLAKAIHDA